ncbi:MAG: ABC transporter ATP-binding protein [Eubacteriales bacterium]|nr:ABC transporter ATP-binding protein [Eubacteriales bacterium]
MANTDNEKQSLSKEELKERRKFRHQLLRSYTWKAKKYFIPGLIIEAVATAANLLGPIIVGKILNDQVISAAKQDGLTFYLQLLLVYLCTMVAGSLLRYASQYLFQLTANNIGRMVQNDVFNHLQLLPISVFDRMPAGTVVSRVTNDSNALKVLYAQIITRLISALIFAVGIYISLASLDYRLFLMALMPLPILAVVFWNFQSKSSRYNRKLRAELSELNGQINENIQGMEVIQSLGREDRVYNDFNRLNTSYFETNKRYTRLYAYSEESIIKLLNILVMAAILAYFGHASLTGSGDVPIGSLYIFTEYMRRLFEQFTMAMQRIGNLTRSLGAADHIFEILQIKTETYLDGEIEDLKGEIQFQDVHFSYIEGEPVLKGINFTLEAGKTAAFVGATGSGKSTIMNLLAGFYPLTEGDILIDGQSIKELPVLSLRRQMAMVLQDPFIFRSSLYRNIALDNKEITPEMAAEALREVGGARILDRAPEGIVTAVESQGKGYSSGERQLISFARALAQEPRILILDEATANIDSETEGLIQSGIKRLQAGRTTLMIAHRLSTIKDANTIYVMDKGEIVEQGTHADLMAMGGLYAKMYEEQSRSSRVA